MRDESRRDLLQDLFSDNDGEDREGDLPEEVLRDLSAAALFSSHEQDKRQKDGRAGEWVEPPRPGPDARVVPVTARQAQAHAGARESVLTPEPSPVMTDTDARTASNPATAAEQMSVSQVAGEDVIEPLFIPRVEARDVYLEIEEAPIGSELAREQERILNVLLGGATLASAVSFAAILLGRDLGPGKWLGLAFSGLGCLVALPAFALRRIPRQWLMIALVGASYALALSSIAVQGVRETGTWSLLAIPVFLFALAGERWAVISGLANVLVYAVSASMQRLGWLPGGALVTGWNVSQLAISTVSLAFPLAGIALLHSLSVHTSRRLRRSLGQQTSALRAAQAASAERQQALERTSSTLDRQARHVGLGAEMGRLATTGLDPNEMMARAVALIRQRVGADYVGLFLLDEDRIYAELCAQSGTDSAPTAGPHEITRITDDVLLRQCVSSGRPRIMLGVDQVRGLTGGGAPSFLLNGTRSALALPLIARGIVFGVISVQSQSPAAFDGDDLAALRNAADQVAIGISNAQLAGEVSACYDQMEALQQHYAREAWDPFLTESTSSVYEYRRPEIGSWWQGGSLPDGEEMPAPLDASEASDTPAVLVPISLRERVLGVLGLHLQGSDAPWTDEQMELLKAVSEQMGLMIENSRLFAEARSRAARERQVREIVARLRQSLDTEEILSTAVREMGEALGLKDVTIRLTGTGERIGE
jgi:GAF domain-containing protein